MDLPSSAFGAVGIAVETHASPGVAHSVGQDGLAAAATAFARRFLHQPRARPDAVTCEGPCGFAVRSRREWRRQSVSVFRPDELLLKTDMDDIDHRCRRFAATTRRVRRLGLITETTPAADDPNGPGP